MGNPKSIFIYGNTNNYPYLLALGFRSLGFDVCLVINKKELLHRPESIEVGLHNGYPDWIHDHSDLTELDYAYQTHKVSEMMQHLTFNADLAILNDIGPSLSNFLSCPHISLLTGSDLTYWANFASLDTRFAPLDQQYRRSAYGRQLFDKFTSMIVRQRDGILMSSVVSYAAKGLCPDGDVLLSAIGVEDRKRTTVYMADTIHNDNQHYEYSKSLRIFCGVRLTWAQNNENSLALMDMKGTNRLIEGFAQYRKMGGVGVLSLPRKGVNLVDAVKMIGELGIDECVSWYDEMPLHEFKKELINADIVCDQFDQSFPGMVTTQAYALGRPVMANFRDDKMPFSMPGFNARSAKEITEILINIEHDPGLLKFMSMESRNFAVKYLSPKTAAQNLLRFYLSR